MRTGGGAERGAGGRPRGEGGFAMISVMLVMVLISGLASTAVLRARMDVAVAGNYRIQRSSEVAADGALEVIKAMLYGNEPQLYLPLSVPSTDAAARAWRPTRPDGTSADPILYSDGDLNLSISLRYKQEDNINYNGTETRADEVVRYGKDYNYQGAPKNVGTQPVYTATFTDLRSGATGEADLITALGFRTPAAIFVKGRVKMRKYWWATDETIEVTSGAGTPALATTRTAAECMIERPTSVDAAGTDYNTNEPSSNCDYVVNGFLHDRPWTGEANATVGGDVWSSFNAGRCDEARSRDHILLGVGNRGAVLGDGNGVGGCVPLKSVFNFDKGDPAVVKYVYRNPDGTIPTLESLLGTSFPDLRAAADQVLIGDQSVTYPNDSAVLVTDTTGKNLTGLPLGTAELPQIIFFESNMDDDGNRTSTTNWLTLTTTAGTSASGYGILVINGDATIAGSINWTGLMIVRGNLIFKPYAGGTNAARSGPDLASRWNGFIMIGGDPSSGYGLALWTFWGGTIILGYSTDEVATIKGIISRTIPHKTLSWRRVYG